MALNKFLITLQLKLQLTIWHRIKSISNSIKITRKNTSTTPNYELFLANCSTVTAHNRGTTILFKMGKCNLSEQKSSIERNTIPIHEVCLGVWLRTWWIFWETWRKMKGSTVGGTFLPPNTRDQKPHKTYQQHKITFCFLKIKIELHQL